MRLAAISSARSMRDLNTIQPIHRCKQSLIQLNPSSFTRSQKFSCLNPTYNNQRSTTKSISNLTSSPIQTGTLPLKKRKFKNVLLVCKLNDKRVKITLETLIVYLARQHPEVCPVLEEDLQTDDVKTDDRMRMRRDQIDLAIALGGDGTVLHIAHLFKNTSCPPILGFNFGTIGFLLHFAPIDKFEVINKVLNGQIEVENRMRLNCFVKSTSNNNENYPSENNDGEPNNRPSSLVELSAINEVSLHRTGCPHMVAVNIHIEGRFLTQAVADGLIVATPTGSTAYSCSAGGSIVYPTMEAILVTPICPRSLSFRPLILPHNLSVHLALDPNSRSTSELRIDGINIKSIQPGDVVEIRASKHPIQLFSPSSTQSNKGATMIHDYWIDDLNLMLNFNRSYQPKDQPPTKEFGYSSTSPNLLIQ